MSNGISGDEWLSQQQAADLVGVPVATVEFAARAGKFVKRDRAPSLQRDSVLKWAERRKKRKRRTTHPRRRAGTPRKPRPPEPEGWLEVGAAAEVLELSRHSVLRLVSDGQLEKRRSGMQWYVREDQVKVLAGERSRWVSIVKAAEIVGCSVHVIETAVTGRRIDRRDSPRWMPSLRRESVERFARQWHKEQAEAEERHRRAQAARRPASAPPDDDHVWLSASTVAAMLGMSTTRVGQLTLRGSLPATKRGRRWWYRRGDIERYAAARAARLSGGRTLY